MHFVHHDVWCSPSSTRDSRRREIFNVIDTASQDHLSPVLAVSICIGLGLFLTPLSAGAEGATDSLDAASFSEQSEPSGEVSKSSDNNGAEQLSLGGYLGFTIHIHFGDGRHLMPATFNYPEVLLGYGGEVASAELSTMVIVVVFDIVVLGAFKFLLTGEASLSDDPLLFRALNRSSGEKSAYWTLGHGVFRYRLAERRYGGLAVHTEVASRTLAREFDGHDFASTVFSAGAGGGYELRRGQQQLSATVVGGMGTNRQSGSNPYVGARLRAERTTSRVGRLFLEMNFDFMRHELDDEQCIRRPLVSCREYLHAESEDWLWVGGVRLGAGF